MMSIEGWYYLHENGSIIYKPRPDAAVDIRDSDLARMLWPLDSGDRMGAWRILVEATAMGADKDRVAELATKWGCTDDDAEEVGRRLGVIFQMDGNAMCATAGDFYNLAESEAGFGRNKLEAMADLAKNLGWRPAKMWGNTFMDVLSGHRAALNPAGEDVK